MSDAIQTFGLLAGAYNQQTEKAAVTHSYLDGAEKTLCKRIISEKLADIYAFSEEDLAAPPTCPLCLKRDPRFKK